MIKDTQTTRDYLDCFFEKLSEFGFEHVEIVIMLMNAGERTSNEKILKAIDFIEPVELGTVREDISKEEAKKEIERILVEG